MASPRVLIVDDEAYWLDRISDVLTSNVECSVQTIASFEEAVSHAEGEEIDRYEVVVIDVRLRPQMYDQGGLAILDILKDRRPDVPVLLLTAYGQDYPGLLSVAKRYRSVLAYDKEVFCEQPTPILKNLFAKLPPQLGEAPLRGPGTGYGAPSSSRENTIAELQTWGTKTPGKQGCDARRS